MNANLRFAIRGAVLAGTALLVGASIILLEEDDVATPREDGSEYLQEAQFNQEQRRLRFCVQAVDFESGPVRRSIPGDPALEEQAKKRIQDALERVAEDPLWVRAGKESLEPPLVDIGCPSPPIMFVGGGDVKILGRRVWEPSYYGVFTFIVPSDEFERVFGGGSPATSEEFVAAGDQAWGLTVGLYLTEAQLEDSDYLTDVMIRAVGIEAFEKTLPR